MRLQHCRDSLLEWKKKETTNAKNQIQNIRGYVERLQKEKGKKEWESWQQLNLQLEDAYKAEGEYLARKSMVEWLQKGNENTRFFHSVTAQRMSYNKIERLEKMGGANCEGA